MGDRWTTLLTALGVWKPSKSVNDTDVGLISEKELTLKVLKKWQNYNSLDDGLVSFSICLLFFN